MRLINNMKKQLTENIDTGSFNSKEHESPATTTRNINTRIKFLQKQSDNIQVRFNRLSDEFRDVIASKYNIAKSASITMSNFVYSKPEGMEYIKQRNTYRINTNHIKKVIGDLKVTLLRNKLPEEFKVLDDHRADSDSRNQESTINIPDKLPLYANGPDKQLNPYNNALSSDSFAGRPWDFPYWTPQRLQEYVTLSELLKRFNLPGFDKMYAGMYHGKYRNFIVIGNKGNFIWRLKTGKMSCDSTIWVNGHKSGLDAYKWNIPQQHAADRTFATELKRSTPS